MTRKITFLHTADLHFGAPMRGFCDLSEQWATRLRSAISEAYDRVIDAALANDVDFVVIAGDMFDTSGASYADYLHFFEGLQKLDDARISTYLTTGNHDPYSVWRNDFDRLPPSCHLLGAEGPEFALFERGDEPLCLIGARGYRNQAWPIDEPIAAGIDRTSALEALSPSNPRAKSAPFCLGIIHTGLDLDQSKAYSDPQALLAADVDYWACGHLHKRLVKPSEERPRIVFPGCIQGRDLKESGERGCFLVTMEERPGSEPPHTTIEFIPTASVVFHTISVDVSACQTLADVARLVQAELFHENGKAGCDEMVERIVLTGATELHDYLCRAEVIRDLRKRINAGYPSFFCDALIDRTQSVRDRRAALKEGLFEAHVLRVSDEQRANGTQMVNYVQSELVKRGIDVPASLVRRVGDFNDAAETLVRDLLAKEEL